jgi:glycosyltransferase involved in cell wall biosynthesis
MRTADRRPPLREGPAAVIVAPNLPVPDDHRVWAQAEALRDDGVAVTVVCPAFRGKAGYRTVVDGVGVVYFRSFAGSGPLRAALRGGWMAVAARRAAKRALAGATGPRTLQVCNPPDLLAGLLRWARRRGCTTVYDQHDVVPALTGVYGPFRRLRGFFEYCERRTLLAADVVITPSQEQVERLRSRYRREAILVRSAAVDAVDADGAAGPAGPARPGARAGRVPPEEGVPGETVFDDTVSDETAFDETALNETAPAETILGYLGLISGQDGVSELIDAVCELRGRGARGFRVEIAGDGPALASVRERARLLGVSDLVTFHGWLGRDAVPGFLERIDAMVVPDPDLEFNHYCAMNKVTYAMARGLPVVLRPLRENARLVGSSPFLAANLTPGAFADAIDALLLAGPLERRQAGECGRIRFERELAWDINAARYLVSVSPGSGRAYAASESGAEAEADADSS